MFPRVRVRSRLLAVLALAAAALLGLLAGARPGLQAQSAVLGEENSWVRIQNVGASDASVDLTFYNPDGTRAATDGCPRVSRCGPISPGSGWSFFQQGFDGLSNGYRGSAFVTVNQPFVGILARDAFKNGKLQIAGDTLRAGHGGSRQYASVVVNNASYVSRITVENESDSADACVQILYYAEGSLVPTVTDPSSGGSGCPDGGTRLAPRGSLIRDERTLPVPYGFDGAAVVRARRTASGVAAEGQQLSVFVDTRDRFGAGLASFRAIDDTEAGRVVVLPMADRGASEGARSWSTRFRIMNTHPEIPNEVTLRFEGTTSTGREVLIENTVTVRGALTCDQSADGIAGCLPSDRPLPSSFVGTVRIQSVDPVAVVAQRVGTDGSFDNYRGLTVADAARQAVLPVVNKNYGPFGDSRGWNSWFRVLTFDGSVANVRVIYYSRQFPGGLFASPVTVDRQRTFRQADESQLPDGWVGSAIIVADRPIVAVVNLENDVFSGDAVMQYDAIGFD